MRVMVIDAAWQVEATRGTVAGLTRAVSLQLAHLLQQPAFFGRRIDAEWRPYSPGMAEGRLVAASYYQHLAACETLRMAGQRGWGLDELAERLGTRKETLRRKLYGESPATIDDITGWALAVETVTVLPAPADLDRMLPPTQAT